jgi:hypothetical protein
LYLGNEEEAVTHDRRILKNAELEHTGKREYLRTPKWNTSETEKRGICEKVHIGSTKRNTWVPVWYLSVCSVHREEQRCHCPPRCRETPTGIRTAG